MESAAGHDLDSRPSSSRRLCTPRPKATRSSSARCCCTWPSRGDRAARRPVDSDVRSATSASPRASARWSAAAFSPVGRGQRRARWAAVIGAEFDLATVEAAGGPSGDATPRCTRRGDPARCASRGGGCGGSYRSPTRSSARRCTRRSRPTAGCACTGALARPSSRAVGRLDAHLDALAYHYGEGALAGDPVKAVDYPAGRAKATTSSPSRRRPAPRPRPWPAGAVRPASPRAAL